MMKRAEEKQNEYLDDGYMECRSWRGKEKEGSVASLI